MAGKKSAPSAVVQVAFSALMAAVIFVATYFLQVPIPGTVNGYANLGDMMIFLCAVILGNPWAGFSAAIGSGIADIVYGAGWYIPATFVIKGLMGFLSAAFAKTGKTGWFFLGNLLCGALMCGGYFVFEMLVFKTGSISGLTYAINSLPMNILQACICVVGATLLFKPVSAIRGRLIKN
ncbi:MAG: ECF transporter S component [Clostridium sp.]|jgi:uncharacterized membrane protein|nr:ECF transporter S component [Clostridium sp.]